MNNNTAAVFDLTTAIYIKPNQKINTNQGKLKIGAVTTGYTKTNISSIPSKTENFLLPIDKRKHRFKYSTESNPGVGEYSLSYYLPQKTESNSSNGYGNGFISKNKRFSPYYSCNPGVGEYQSERTKTIMYQITNSINGKSLYNAKQTPTNKQIINYPGPASYNPIQQIHQANYYFCLGEERFNDDIYKTPHPGPCDYSPFSIKEENAKKRLKCTYKRKSISRKKDIVQLLNLNTHQINKDLKFIVKQNDKRRLNMNNKPELSNTSLNSDSKTKKEEITFASYIQTETERIKRENDHDIKFAIAKEKELKMIKEMLGNGGVPDKFLLCSPRWKHKNHFSKKYPGPAYYSIDKIPGQKHSFNRNISDFLVPSGPLTSSY